MLFINLNEEVNNLVQLNSLNIQFLNNQQLKRFKQKSLNLIVVNFFQKNYSHKENFKPIKKH